MRERKRENGCSYLRCLFVFPFVFLLLSSSCNTRPVSARVQAPPTLHRQRENGGEGGRKRMERYGLGTLHAQAGRQHPCDASVHGRGPVQMHTCLFFFSSVAPHPPFPLSVLGSPPCVSSRLVPGAVSLALACPTYLLACRPASLAGYVYGCTRSPPVRARPAQAWRQS
ncbi:hypothetical protein GGS23DRAFT_576462 [Durotheca rogersii]|uniref:uncharacterized protein n=1 Tax=Durotheca rogersii TaxID=419775 RepID=UPI00221F73DB|nr:uncharacterized protein GGS23DRAFT_576462 [Durotheca rogersii]KAI5861354.1 hypothetical protein GGS23DRAFT_576462 [Durotheca rogersii]